VATFEPVVEANYKTTSQRIEEAIMLLYAKGTSNTDIIYFIGQTYGVHYSPSKIFVITN